jgi:NAD(P)-dependent dehydrogenase (short-subunit alcohol dehydrogenase family)
MAEYGTVVITGANRGIGLEFVRRFANCAERVIACCRNPARAAELDHIGADSRGSVQIKTLDVTDYPAVKALAATLNGEPVDLLLNNAGMLGPRPDLKLQEVESWRQVLEVNTIAPLKMAEAFVDSVAASRRKLIVNITSKMGSIGDNTSGSAYIYRSSKSALNSVMKSFSIDNADQGLTVLMLHPGWVKTDMGGPDALIDVATSVDGMMAIIDSAGPEQSGRCFDYDGSPIPW